MFNFIIAIVGITTIAGITSAAQAAPPAPNDITIVLVHGASVLGTIKGPIVLVGHSYGGSVITNAARGHTNVKALVYVDGTAPDIGES